MELKSLVSGCDKETMVPRPKNPVGIDGIQVSLVPGELDKMLSMGKFILPPVDTYKHWFESLLEDFHETVIEQWGEPEQTGIMKSEQNFIIPAVQVDNLLLLLESARSCPSPIRRKCSFPTSPAV